MGFLVAAIFIITGLFIYAQNKNWTTPSVLFCLLWGVVSFLASLRLYDINEAGINTWLVILIGTISFVTGASIIRINGKREPSIENNNNKEFNSVYCCYLSSKTFWILFAIIGIVVTIDVKNSIELMQLGYSLDLIRAARYGLMEINGYMARSDSLSILISLTASALQIILIAVGIEYFILNTKKNWKFILAAVYLVIAGAFSDGGRWGLAYFIIELFVCYELLKDKGRIISSIKITKKTKKKLIVLFIILIATVVIITELRWSGDIRKHFYLYLCGCVPLLDCKIQDIDKSGFYSIIFGSQYGIWSFFIPIIQKILGISIPVYQDSLTNVMTGQEYCDIGGGSSFNAFVTSFYYLYADFRWLAVILGMMLFGLIAGKIYRSAVKNDRKGCVVPYLIITQMILKSIQTYPLTANVYVLVFVFMLVIYIARNVRIIVNR